jgi:hypothetical protein
MVSGSPPKFIDGVYNDVTGTVEKPNPLRDVYLEFPRAMLAIAKVTAFGASKHAPRAWRTLRKRGLAYALNYHISKIGRHLLKLETDGPVNKEDGDALHMAQVAWNSLAHLEHYLTDQEEKAKS